MSKNKCPNINDKEYKNLSAIVGDAKAHTIYAKNNGNPVSLTADGNPSLIYQQLVERHGEQKAVSMRTKMFTDRYETLSSNSTSEILDQNDNIILSDGTMVQLGEKMPQTKAMAEMGERKAYVETAEKTNSLIGTISKALPGFNIQIESFDTVKDTEHRMDRGWVDNNGIHYNTQTMTYDTPIHEATHLWLHALEMGDPHKFNLFMNKVEESIKENPEIMDAIKKKYWKLDKEYQMYEYAATISGFSSVAAVNKFFARNNRYVNQERTRNIFIRFMNMVRNFFNDVKSIISEKIISNETSELENVDFEKGTLNDIFKALTTDILNGKRIINYGPKEVEQLLATYYGNGLSESSKSYDMISNIKSIVPILIGNKEKGENDFANEEEKDELAKYIHKSLYSRPSSADKIFLDYGKLYVFPDTMSETEVMNKIKNEIITRRYRMMQSFNDNIVDILNRHISERKTPLESIIKEVFSEYNFTDKVITAIVRSIKLLGINEPMTQVMNYSNIVNVPELSHLYNDALLGYNPIVIVHTLSDSKVDISLVDLTGSVLGFQDNKLDKHKKGLVTGLGVSKSNKGRDFDMSNSQGDIRQILIATTIAGMNKLSIDNNKKLTLRRFGVVGFNGTTVQPRMLSSLKKVMVNSRDLFTLPVIQSKLDPSSTSYNWFQQLLNDDKAWDEGSIYQSWKDKLETYYSAYYQELGMNEVQRDSFMSNFNSYEHYVKLRERAMEIERKNSNWLNDPEHKLITQYKVWYEQGVSINNGQVKDINKTWMKLTNVHNMNSDILQNFSIRAEETKSIIVNQVNGYKKEFEDLMKKSLLSRGKSLHVMGNLPKNVFGHLFKDGELMLENDYKEFKAGQIIPIKLYNQLYGSYDMEEAIKAGLTKEDIAFSDFIIKSVQERYIANEIHNSKSQTNPDTEEEIRLEVLSKLVPGHVPVLDKTKLELIREGKYWTAFRKGWDEVAIAEFMAGNEDIALDDNLIGDDYQNMHTRFGSQMYIQQQLTKMGLSQTDDVSPNRFEGDMHYYNNKTMNLEYMFNMFIDDSIRTIEIENRMIPAMNSAIQWSQILKEEYNIQNKYTQEFLNEYVDRIMVGKSQDDPTDKTAAIIKNITNAYSYVALGYRPLVWVRSAYFNTQSQIVESLAMTAANKFTEEAKRLNFPSASDMAKANKEVALNMKKAVALGRKLGIIDGSEMEAIESFFTTNIDKNVFQAQLAHVGNYYTDRFARLVTMTAFMIHDGSYEAHSYDKETGKLKYDKLKDGRYFKDGNYIGEKEKAIWERKLAQMTDTGLVKEGEEMEVGYSFEEANTRFKWYSDKFIIGAMDDYQKVLLGNTFAGRVFTQFRTFLPGKIFNLVASSRMTSYGADITANLNENNEWETIKEQIKIEGTLASMWNLMSDVVKVVRTKGMSLSDIEALDPMTVYNLTRSTISAVFFTSILVGLTMAANNGMSDRDKDKLSWLYSELMSYTNLASIKTNIFPIAGLFDTIYGLMTGGKWTRIIKYTGPVYDTIWFLELLGDNDNVLQDWTQRKVNDMNAKELQEHYEKVALERSVRLEREANALQN